MGRTTARSSRRTARRNRQSETGKILVETERVLLEAARERKFPAVILRLAGIYGPDRGYWFKQYLKNEARIEGNGARILNMIHRDDVAGAIIAALKSGRPGEIYNAVDDEPVSQLSFFQWLSGPLGKELPPSAPEDAEAVRKRGVYEQESLQSPAQDGAGLPVQVSHLPPGLHGGIAATRPVGGVGHPVTGIR